MSKPSIENSTGPLLHTVFFWLKNPENDSARKTFETAIRKLIRTNPQATANHLGCPAASEKREVVDNTFTYCYTMSFPSVEAQNMYQEDPTHQLFIEEGAEVLNATSELVVLAGITRATSNYCQVPLRLESE